MEKGRGEKKETSDKKPTNYIQLINVLMWEMIYPFVSKLFSCLSSSTLFVIPKVQGRSVISLTLVTEN